VWKSYVCTHLLPCILQHRMATTPFNLAFKKDLNNEVACEKTLSAEEQRKFRKVR